MPGAIDPRGIKQFLRHLLEELPHQEHAEDTDQARQNQ